MSLDPVLQPARMIIMDSVAAEVAYGGKKISKGKMKSRLVIETPYSRTDLNVAMSDSAKSSRTWVPLNVKIGKKGKKKKERTVFVNVSSLAKRLDLKKTDIRQAAKNHNLENLVFDQMADKLAEIKAQKPVRIFFG